MGRHEIEGMNCNWGEYFFSKVLGGYVSTSNNIQSSSGCDIHLLKSQCPRNYNTSP